MKNRLVLGCATLALSLGVACSALADTAAKSNSGGGHSPSTALQAPQGDHATITVDGAFARQSVGKFGVSGAFMTIRNLGEHPDRLIGVSTPAAGKAEIHQTSMDAAGVMKMRPVEAIDIPAGGRLALKPGGLHIMLTALAQELTPGMEVPLTLLFESAGAVTVTVAVMAVGHGPTGSTGMDRGHADEGSMGTSQ